MSRVVAHVHRGAQVYEMSGGGGRLSVRARNDGAPSHEEFGDDRHSRATNSNKVVLHLVFLPCRVVA